MHECAKLCGLRAFVTYVPLRDFLRDLRTFIFLLALRTLIFLTVLHTYMLPYIPAFTFLSVSNFDMLNVPLLFYIKCGTTHNQPQQAGTS